MSEYWFVLSYPPLLDAIGYTFSRYSGGTFSEKAMQFLMIEPWPVFSGYLFIYQVCEGSISYYHLGSIL